MSDQTDTAWPTGTPYSIKRHGVTITNCDSEPVQTPGCVQAHGMLIVAALSERTILQVSENCHRYLGQPAEALLGKSVAAVLGQSADLRLVDLLAIKLIDRNPIYLMTLPAGDGMPPLDVIAHTVDGVIVLELEAMDHHASPDPDYYAVLRHTVSRLQHSRTLDEFCAVVASEVRAITRLDRVMIYKFHEDGHGEVVAESRRDDLTPWLGLHYPAEDIPKPAREVFKQVWVRPVPDIDGELAELVPLANPQTGKPLTMTHCALRGASVMYTEYLRNMGVRASLTMPIRREGELWGLIACHHYAPAPITYQVRAVCELLAQVASLQHAAAENRDQLLYRIKLEGVHQQLVAVAAQEGGLAAMTDRAPTLLDGLDASGAALYHRDRWWRVGVTPSEAALDALRAWLSTRPEFASPMRPVYATDSLSRAYPAASDFADIASGLLAVPVSRAHQNLILWFRPETIQSVNWGGNPHDKPTTPGPHGPRLTPRKSFELFTESVRGRSAAWKTVELESALRLRLLIMELVVSRAERLAMLNADLAQSNEELDAFAYVASHDLKEPLRGIHKYAHQLLEDAATLDEASRRKVEGLMRLTLRMDSLIDSLLHFSRVGRTELTFQPTDLDEVLDEALEMVAVRRGERQTELVKPRKLPVLRCDRTRVREILANLLSNSIKYNDKAVIRIEVGYIAPDEDAPRTNWPPEALRHTTFFVKDNGLGIDPRHHAQVFALFKRLHGRDAYGGGTGAGLTIVMKLVERHRGRIWIDSKVRAGTTFYFTLPCEEEVPA